MQTPGIKFSKNWNNKLDNKEFTSIRRSSVRNNLYYIKNINKIFNIFLREKFYCKAKLVWIEIRKFNQIPKNIIENDTGMDYNNSVELFNNFGIKNEDNVLVLYFNRI